MRSAGDGTLGWISRSGEPMRRVVVTGLGAVAPEGSKLAEFRAVLERAETCARSVPEMAERGLACRVAALPAGVDEEAAKRFEKADLSAMGATGRLAGLAAVEAWTDAGLVPSPRPNGAVDWDSGAVFGSGAGDPTAMSDCIHKVDAQRLRALGSSVVERCMASHGASVVGGLLGLGNQLAANSSACATGTEAIAIGFDRVRSGRALRMVCGGAETPDLYIWAAFDAMRVLSRKWNEAPARASRPLSRSSAGFVPGAGAGALVLEDLDAAIARGAPIRAEVLGAAVNSGGQRNGGSTSAPNPEGQVRCIAAALRDAAVGPDDVDAVNAHLTGTYADRLEIASWRAALGRSAADFPSLTATKGLIGHTLAAAGALESVASVLMLQEGFLHPNANCEDLLEDCEDIAHAVVRPRPAASSARVLVKAGFGFGDVNACIVLRRWEGV